MVDLRNPLRAAAEPPSQPFPLFRTAFPSHFSCHSARDQRLSFLSLWCCFQHRTTQTDAFPCGAASNTGLHRRGSEHQEAAVLWLQGQQRDVTESYGCVRSAECTYSAVNNYGVRSAECGVQLFNAAACDWRRRRPVTVSGHSHARRRTPSRMGHAWHRGRIVHMSVRE